MEEVKEAMAEMSSSESGKVSGGAKEKVVFPPAATWYRTNATASRDDMWAYLAGQSIVLVTPKVIHTRVTIPEVSETDVPNVGDPNRGNRVWPKFEVFGYQREQYNCISFCQAPWDYLPVKKSPLVTGCKEGFVRIWDVTTGECVLYYDIHKQQKNVAVACLDWSSQDRDVIYSMDEEGTFVSFYIPKLKLKSVSLLKGAPTSLQASPHEANIIAFGTKSGVVHIAQVDAKGKGGVKILHKVRHDEEIVATLWCPKLGWRMSRAETSSPTEVTGSVIASCLQSPKPPTIRLWSRQAEDRGIYHVWEKDRNSKPFRNFTPLLWATDPNSGSPLLITCSKYGQIISYSQDTMIPDIVHDIHNHNLIFGLVQCGDILWSTSYEPAIVGFNLRTMAVSCVIPTFKGVCAIAPSPSVGTGSLLAIGGVDACIRVVDFEDGYPCQNSFKVPNISSRMRSKIMALAWHPKRDNLLGFGTDDGILGTFEVRDGNKHLMTLEHRVSGVVYSVDWGPYVTAKDFKRNKDAEDEKDYTSSIFLYACGGKSVFMIQTSKSSNPLINVSRMIDSTNPKSARMSGLDSAAITVVSKAADIRWSPDFTLFAVGYNDGRVELYTPPFLQLKCWIKCHSRAIQYLSWRSNDFLQSQLTPDYKHRWFATTSNDATVRLFDLKNLFEKEFLENDSEEPKLLITSQAKLSSPSEVRIISCAWSPHDSNLLVTVSYDSTAIVWQITEAGGVPVARYFGHGHRLVACAFHPRNKFEVITASDEFMFDSTMHVWDYRDHPYSDVLPEVLEKHPEKPEPVRITGKGQDDFEKNSNDTSEETKKSVKDASNHLHVADTSLVQCMGKIGHGKSRGGTKTRTLLSSTSNSFTNVKHSLETELRHLMDLTKVGEQNRSQDENGPKTNGGIGDEAVVGAAQNSTNHNQNGEGSEENLEKSMIHLGMLGNYGQCVDLVKTECESHASRGNWEKGCLLASWIGDTDFIERAIDEDFVTETIVNLAKSMSKPVYKKACEKLAQKLVLQEDISKAATYLLQGGWKHEAIDLLTQHGLFRDAITILVTNPSKTDAVKKVEIMNKWLQQLVQDGSFEVAAKVYCSMGQYQDALTVIERRDHPYAWKAGMFLADKCGDDTKLKLLGFKFCVHSITTGTHMEAKEIVLKYKGLNWLLPFVVAHEVIFNQVNKYRDEGSFSEQFDFQKILKMQLDTKSLMNEGVVDMMESTILVSIPQNQFDAEVILLRTLLVKLLGGDCSSTEEDYMKLCENWLPKDKKPHLHTAYVNAYNSFLS